MRSVAYVLSTSLRRSARFLTLAVVLAGLALPAMATTVTYGGSTGGQNFGTVNIGSSNSAILAFNVSGGAIGSVEVVTQGTPNLDFTDAGGGSCTDGTTSACTVDVTFKPIYAGLRRGAVLFWSGPNNSGNVVGKTFIYGVGNGGQIIYGQPVISVVATPSGFGSWSAPEAVAFDGANDLWVDDNVNNRLVEIPVTGSASAIGPTVTGGGTLGNPLATELNGAGDVVISDNLNQRMLILPVGGGTPISIVPGNVAGTYYSYPMGFAVDGLGNIIVPDEFNYRVLKITNPESSPTFSVVGLGGNSLLWPTDVWLDAAGDLYIADFGSDPNSSVNPASNPQVLEVFPNGTSQKLATPGCTLQSPASAEADPAGNIFIGDITVTNNGQTVTGGRVIELPAGGGNCIVTTSYTVDPNLGGGNGANGPGVGMVNLNAAGDVYVSDYSNNIIIKLQRSVAPTVAFTHSTTIDTVDSTDGTKTVQITNIGNTTLDFNELTYPADFPVGSASNQCTSSSSIPINGSCNVAIEFSPQNAGSLNEDVILGNNANGGSQSITVTGDATGIPPSITSGNSTTFAVGTLGSFTVTASGTPSPTFSETGALPSGVTLSSSGVLSGTPAAGSGGAYSFTITAANGATPNGTQIFTLKVNQPPAITSGNSTTFTTGSAYSFTVNAGGYPVPTFSETGALPSGVTFSSSGVLSGTPAAGTGGTYPLTITASNGIGADSTQGFTLTVNAAPSITSANNATFMAGSASSFTVTTIAFPTAAFSASGALPSGVTFIDNGNGTATLSGTPAVGTGGAYPLIITASNGTSPNATQSFTLAVDEAPSITSANSATFSTGLAGSFTVTTTGYPAPAFSETGSLPSGITFTDNGNGTATLGGTPAIGSAGSYPLTITASNGIGANASESFTLTINPPPSYVVTTIGDDATGSPSNCPTPSSGNTCTLRDALAAAAAAGSGVITFDPTAFASAQIIYLPNGTLTIPGDTSITGPTKGSGYTLSNLVTVDGGGTVGVFSTTSVGVTVNNLAIQNGNANVGGGIENDGGALTVANSTFTNNVAGEFGGAIVSFGTTTVTNSTFTGNSAAYGGGILDYGGMTTISNSTFTNNTAFESGGGIYDNDTMTVSSSTVVGNFSDGSGGGLFNSGSVLGLANSVISGNTSGSGTDDVDDEGEGGTFWDGSNVINGNLIGTYNGIPANGTNVSLAPLLTFGGPTQTMIPLPGSPAICAGLSANIPNGVTTDQRGLPLQPAGSYCPSGSVDAGAVQTNYTMAFSTQPPATGIADQPISPAPALSLSESAQPFPANSGTVTMTDGAGLLGGTTSETFSSGAVTFNNLTISQAINNDLLIATLSLNGPVSITKHTRTLITVTTIAATLTPASGTLSASQTFSWSNGDGPTKFELLLGTGGNGTSDIYDSGITTATSETVTIPSGGVTVYGTLRQIINGAWQVSRYTFMEPGSPTPATLTPSSGTLSTSQTFTWNNGVGASYYGLLLGTTGPGSTDIYNSQETTATSATVSIPSNGVLVYGTLRQLINGTWQVTNYTFMEPGTSTPATLTPSSGTLLSSQPFTWNNGAGPVQFTLLLGTTGPGSADLYNTQVTTATSATVTIPSNGLTVYGTLRQLYNGTWMVTRYTFMESGSPTPATLTPSSGTLSASQTFTWNNGAGPVDFTLLLGTTGPGSTDIYNSEVTTATSATVSIPTNGVTVYGTLRQLINGAWVVTRYTFTEP